MTAALVLPFDEYISLDAVNWSTLREMRRSPLHYRYRLQHARKDTATLRAGRAAHTAVFEPDRFALDYAVFKGKTRRGKTWDAFVEAHPGQTILRVAEYNKALAYRDAVRAHSLAIKYLARGTAERTIQWRDDETGLTCKARLDFISDSAGTLVDLKGTSSISYGQFISTAYRLGYHRQLGFYQWGLREALGLNWTVTVLAVESEGPHDVVVFEYDADLLAEGLTDVRSLLTKLAYHRERDTWPGMYECEQVLGRPRWADQDANEDLTELELEK